MVQYKTIDFVCTGNNGRSPIAGAIAQDYIVKQGLDRVYRAISSGSHVDRILSGNMPTGLKKTVVVNGTKEGVCRDYGLAQLIEGMTPGQIDEKNLTDDEFKERFETSAETCRQFYAKNENSHCNEVASEYGIEKYLDGNFKQAKPSPGTVAVMAMGEGNRKAVQEMYDATGHNPIIAVISKYVLGGDAQEVPNTFGKSEADYRAMVEDLKPLVVKAVEKIVRETS